MPKIFAITLVALFAITGILYLSGGEVLWKINFLSLITNEIPVLKNLEEKTITTIFPKDQNIFTPPPLRVIKEAPQATLSKSGVINWTNTQRAQNGLISLKENAKLNSMALIKAEDILEKQYFAHESPLGIGVSDLAKQAGYIYIVVGENLALGNFASDWEVVIAWMDSPGHRANILNEKFSEIGVAAIQGMFEGRQVWVVVQEFGKPASDCPVIDENLKIKIQANEILLNQLSEKILKLKTEINSLSRRSSIYRQKVEEYNELVEEYNFLAKETQELILEYNKMVEVFNMCVQK